MPGNGSEEQHQQNRIVSTFKHEPSGSPERPSYSPVTPTLSQASLPPGGHQTDLPQWMDEEPESLPVSLDDNSDAIALRAALSILQIQRQRALKDMRDLDKMKKAALENPDQFVKDLEDGKLNHSSKGGVAVDDLEDPTNESSGGHVSRFGEFPSAQNVTRCPPVEWAKYHVVGEPLDRMHEVQQHYPGYTEYQHDGPDRPQPHVIAAPYRPFVDKLDQVRTTKKS